MPAFSVFCERPDKGDKACERLLDTESFDEAVANMEAARRDSRMVWVEPWGQLDSRFHVEVPRETEPSP